ncbi:MAG: HAMP domain-containing sensor histidine kinase [Desulfovibrionales bacterium]
MRFSFRSRLFLTMGGVLFLAVFVPGWYLHHNISREIKLEEKARAGHELFHVEWLLSTAADDLDSPRQLQAFVTRIGRSLDSRVTLINNKGVVLADSEVPFASVPTMDNHGYRPEVVEAGRSETGSSIRYSDTLPDRPLLLYIAKQTELSPIMEDGFLRLAVPYSIVQARLNALSKDALFILLPSFLVLAFLGYLLVRHLDSGIQVMIDTAEAIGHGNHRKRIRVVPVKDFEPLAGSINSMADGIEEQIKTITRQKGQLEGVLNAIREGVAVLDENCIIRDVNPYLERIFPQVDDLRGLRPLELIRSPKLQKICEQVALERKEGRFAPADLQVELHGEKHYDVSIVPLQATDIDLALVMVFHDISEMKKLEAIRRDFVANVSHELRTPLTSIKGYAETLMASGDMDPKTRDSFFQIIIKNTNTMSALVRDLLQLAKLESSGEKDVRLQPVDPKKSLYDAWRSCQALAEEKDVHLEDFLPNDGPGLLVHPDQLTQVFRNLLENAIRYGPPSEAVTVFGSHADGMMTIGIKDRGRGIPDSEKGRIFERFYRIDQNRRHRDFSGTGLGLAICRHIIRNHGGNIWVESPPAGESRGSVFFFRLKTNGPVSRRKRETR